MHRIAILLASLLLVTVVACGGDSDDPETPDASPTGGATQTATEPPTSGDAGAAFEELAAGFEEAVFAVTYHTETAIAEPPFTGEEVTVEWDWKQSGEQTRFDFDGGMVGFEGTMIIITTPAESLICVGQGCLGSDPELPIYGSPSGPLSDAVRGIADRVNSGDVTEVDAREIAGAQARCFEFQGADGAQGTVCLSESGVPLFADIDAEAGAMLLEATSYTETVEDTEFEPPYEVTGI